MNRISVVLTLLIGLNLSSIFGFAQIDCDSFKNLEIKANAYEAQFQNRSDVVNCLNLDSFDYFMFKNQAPILTATLLMSKAKNNQELSVTVNEVYLFLDSILFKSVAYDSIKLSGIHVMRLLALPGNVEDEVLLKCLKRAKLDSIKADVVAFKNDTENEYGSGRELLSAYYSVRKSEKLNDKLINEDFNLNESVCDDDLPLLKGRLPYYTNLEDALNCSKENGKPLLIYFTGFAAVGCRKMDDQILSDNEVMLFISENYTFLMLFVDDRSKLPATEHYKKKLYGRTYEVNTIGRKNSVFQIEKFEANYQPCFAIVKGDLTKLNEPIGYTPDIEKFLTWLRSGDIEK
ncbi:MAG: hypothetical protein JXQ87_11990 [Bacteroidia bacterium]